MCSARRRRSIVSKNSDGLPTFAIPLSTAMLPIFAARDGMIPCQPTPPFITPGTCWTLRGSRRASGARPGSVKPRKWSGLKSIHTPVQFVAYPIAPEKIGIVRMLMISGISGRKESRIETSGAPSVDAHQRVALDLLHRAAAGQAEREVEVGGEVLEHLA